MKKAIGIISLLLIIMVLATGCPNPNRAIIDNGKYNIVATTSLIADLIKSIGGDYVNVYGLMGPGIDPHLYKASAGDVVLMQNADMLVYNGIHLEGRMGDVFEKIQETDKLIMPVSQGIDEGRYIDFVSNPGNYDPHIWFDVSLWKEAARQVARGLRELDYENSSQYDKNLEAYLMELDELDGYIRKRVEEIPKEGRVLVTAHDAFSYFGRAYDFEVRGLQGISTSAEAGTGDLRDLANFIVDHRIKAVFVESSVPRKSIEALQEAVMAQGLHLEIGGELHSDSTGDIGTRAETYIGTFKENVDTIIDALK